MLRIIISLIFPLITTTALAQDDCTLYQKSSKNIEQYKKEIEQNTYKTEKSKWQEKVKNESGKAAILLESCTTANPSSESTETLSRWYKIAKLFIDAQMYDKAMPFLEKCEHHPESHSYVINGIPLDQLAGRILARCQKARTDESMVTHVDITYQGKGAFIRKIIPLNYEELEDQRPYLSEEIESLSMRTLKIKEINKSAIDTTYKSLLPGMEVFYHSPFILAGSYSANPGYLEYIYEIVVKPTASRLFAEFFDNARLEYAIPIYLFGDLYSGYFNQKDYLDFIRYCEKIHFRSCGLRVAYYLPHDNSVMVWLATGGGTLNHELVHALMEADFPFASSWLSEGIASMNEEYGRIGGVDRPQDNYRLFYLLDIYKCAGCFIPIEQLIGLVQKDFSDSLNSMLYSAFSRYFCMYLWEHGVLSKIYKEMRDQPEKSGASQIAIIEKNMKSTLPEIQADWEKWVLDRKQPEQWKILREEIQAYIKKIDRLPWSRLSQKH
ncbi:MAG TPA: hypothetical protein ACFYDZ_08250 [Candidatus Brocadiaceae bacterium]